MRAKDFIIEKDITDLKKDVANQIIALPETPPVEKTLGEIEDILKYVNAGGKMAGIKGELLAIPDKVVAQSHKLLAKYISTIDMTSKQRDEMFKMWKEDKIVNRDKLLSGKNLPLSEIFNGYSNNPGIRDLVDDLSSIAFLGQGKGEFLLSVLSKNINKMGKGDLKIDNKAVEVKTLDGGSGRFFDQEVKPSSEYTVNRDAFMKKYGDRLSGKSKSGVNLTNLVNLVNNVDDKNELKKDVTSLLQGIFPDQDIDKLVNAIMSGKTNEAKQLYAKTNLGYYFAVKNEREALDGVLYIDLANQPMTMMFFEDLDDLEKEGYRLHADTIYPIAMDIRGAYPQITIVPTKQGMISSSPDAEKQEPGKKDVASKTPEKKKEEPVSTGIPAVDQDIAGDNEPKMRQRKD